jgi:glycosyltransferase involved in cell wall biosynthesis
MNKKLSLIIFLPNDWEKSHRKQLYLALTQEFANDAKILFVELPVTLIHTLIKYPQKWKKWVKGNLKTRQVAPNAYVTTPFCWEHFLLAKSFPILAKANRNILHKQLKTIFQRLDFHSEKIVWVHRPEQVDILGVCDEKYLIYDCFDDMIQTVEGKEIPGNKKREIHLVEKANIVFTTSRKLYDRQKKINKNTFYIHNGVDFDFLNQAVKKKYDLPNDIRNIRKPIVGYIGKIRDWIDFQILEYSIKNLPNISFVFIGDISPEVRELTTELSEKFNNVHFLGFRYRKELVRYIAYFDCGWIPFKINDFTESVFPNKFMEYLAVGLPVVSSRLVDLIQYEAYAYLYETKDGCIKNLIQACNDKDQVQRSERIHLAQKNSWKNKSKLMEKIIFQIVCEKMK